LNWDYTLLPKRSARGFVAVCFGLFAVIGFAQDPRQSSPAINAKALSRAAGQAMVLTNKTPPPARAIHLRAQAIEPAKTKGYLPGAAGKLSPAPGRRLFVIQFKSKVARQTLEELNAAGFTPLQYLPDDAYIVYGDATRLPQNMALTSLAWAGPLDRSAKLHPAVQKRLAAASSQSSIESITVQYFDSEDAAATEKSLRALAQEPIHPARAGNHYTVRMKVRAQDLAALADLPLVYNVEPQAVYQLNDERQAMIVGTLNDPTAKTIPSPTTGARYQDFLARKGMDGKGVTVEILDDGLDRGLSSNAPGSAHADLVGRIAGILNFTNDLLGDGTAGHGTLNSSIIMGQPKTAATLIDGQWLGKMDGSGFQLGQGIAPGARILAGKIFRNDGSYDAGGRTFGEILAQCSAYEPRVANNSWGEDVFGEYIADCADFDALVRDSSSTLSGDQPLTICFSSGNAGGNTSDPRGTIGAPASAKNVIAVGATENSDAGATDGCQTRSTGSDDATQIARFSSRGPTADHRLGVTLVAPGTHIYGAAPSTGAFDGSGVCGGVNNDGHLPNEDAYYPAGQTDYTWSSGTSHSAPAVAAGAALYTQYHKQRYGLWPSPALVKAALVNSAVPIPGDTSFSPVAPYIPNVDVGWGRLNIEGLIPDANQSYPIFIADQDYVLTATGQVKEYVITPMSSARPLKITLAWTDAPAFPQVYPSLVNDLDLRVIHNNETYLGNMFEGGVSVTGGNADHNNNLECVYIPNPSGTYRIQVSAALLAGDGIPSRTGATDQDYALFVSGGLNDTPKGALQLDRRVYGLVDRMRIHLSDSDLRGQTSAAVTVKSTSSAPLTVTLKNTVNGGGIFESTLDLRGVFPIVAGQLPVGDGDTITVTYNDANDGTGKAAIVTSTAVVDGKPPVLSNVQVQDISYGSARISFRTDEPTTATVSYGIDCATPTRKVQDATLTKQHRVTMGSLAQDTLYNARIKVQDSVGNFSLSACVPFKTEKKVCGQTYNLESGTPAVFSHQAALGSDSWAVAESPYAHSPSHAWFCPNPATPTDSWLTFASSSQILPRASLVFWHTFGLDADYDGAVLEYSLNGGASWNDLGPFITQGGYNSLLRATASNPLSGRRAWSGKAMDAMTRVEVNLASFAGKNMTFRFRMGCDNYQGGEGWLIDDVRLCSSLGSRGVVQLNAAKYRRGENVMIYLSDLDLAGQTTAFAQVMSSSEASGEMLSMTALGSGHFMASVPLVNNPASNDGALGVSDGDVISVVYQDQDDGTGTPNLASATAIVDARCATVSQCEATTITSRAAYVTVKTDEPAHIGLLISSAKDKKQWTINSPAATTEFKTLLTDLTPCSLHSVNVITTDTLGNACTMDRLPAHFVTPDDQLILFEDAEGVTTLVHGANSGIDDWAQSVDANARSPVRSWQVSDPQQLSDKYLRTQPFTIQPGDMLTFWHTYQFEMAGKAYFDGGVVEISTDGVNWEDLERGFAYDTAYDGALSTVFDNPLGGRRAFTGGKIGTMKPAFVKLDRWAGANRMIRWRVVTDSSGSDVGWHIDDVRIVHQQSCGTYSNGVKSGHWRLYD